MHVAHGVTYGCDGLINTVILYISRVNTLSAMENFTFHNTNSFSVLMLYQAVFCSLTN